MAFTLEAGGPMIAEGSIDLGRRSNLAPWLHALDTPPRALYYLSPGELAEYKLVTTASPVASK